MRPVIFSCCFIYCLFVLLVVPGCIDSRNTAEIRINGHVYSFEVAASDEARSKGLMHRKKMAPETGMLFIYPRERYLYFYMKNTLIPLDIAFLNKDGEIVDIRQMWPLDETIIRSKKRAKYALEVNRGFFDRLGAGVGDRLDFMSSLPPAE